MKFLLGAMLVLSQVSYAQSLKDTFISRVMKECGKTKDQALGLATPGRTGNVARLRLCPQNPFKVADDCKLKCSNQRGTVVGN